MERQTQVISDKWRYTRSKEDYLGSGAFGDVYKGEEILTGQKVAIKEVSLLKLKQEFPE